MLPSYILLTTLAAQFIYIVINWTFFRRKEYAFYSVYIVCVTAYFLNKYWADPNGIVDLEVIRYHTATLDKNLAILSYIFYFKFGRHFVEAETRYPFMNRLMKHAETFLFCYVLFNVLLHTFGFYELETALFLPVNATIFVALIYIFITMLKKNEMLDRFILTGSMFYAISACITLWAGQGKDPLDFDHIVVLQIGTIVEMILLNAGLVYKSRMLQRQTLASQRQLIEKYDENQNLLVSLGNIRERITRDLHDDVGATLSSIAAYSEILKQNPDNPVIADLIRQNSTGMIERLEVIAWATNPQHDHFKSLQNQVTKYATPLCHSNGIHFSLDSSGISPETLIPGEVRQNIFLVVKEALNNTIKYAEASECNIKFVLHNDELILTIADNGRGCDNTIRGTGNGLRNMRKRAELLNGRFEMETGMQKGTVISMIVPYPYKIPNSWDSKS